MLSVSIIVLVAITADIYNRLDDVYFCFFATLSSHFHFHFTFSFHLLSCKNVAVYSNAFKGNVYVNKNKEFVPTQLI